MDQHENTAAHGQTEGHGDIFRTYLMVFGALAILTAVSFGAYVILGHGMGSLSVIMLVSIVKASLVAVIFMHLKWDWGKVFGIMLPVVIMAIMMIIVLLPDMLFAPSRIAAEEESVRAAEQR